MRTSEARAGSSAPVASPLEDVVRSRRSIRAFSKRDVPPATVRAILDLARHAPSSMNGQPWHFVVIRDPARKARLVRVKNEHCPPEKKAFPADFLAGAPVVVAVCVDEASAHERGVESAVLATAILLLAAQDRGLASVYLSARQPDDPSLARAIGAILELPEGIEPITLIPLGYPEAAPAPKALRDLGAMIHHGRYGELSRDD